MSRWLFIDPGTKRLGWATFNAGDGSVWLAGSGMLEAPRKLKWEKRLDWMVRGMLKMMQTERRGEKRGRVAISDVVIEMPQIFFSQRGEAASNSGAVLKLVAVVFSLRQMLLERGYAVHLVKVSRWKGQVRKGVTARRVERHWGRELTVDEKIRGGDELDACGIGDYWFRKGPGKGLKVCK